MGTTLYTVEFYQKGGPGVLTFHIGREEAGIGAIHVQNWPLTDSSKFQAPMPGFGNAATREFTPAVTDGTGFILNYNDPEIYFPKPYALMSAALLTRDYSKAFVTYPECHRSWEIVTASGPAECLDPAPQEVKVYAEPK